MHVEGVARTGSPRPASTLRRPYNWVVSKVRQRAEVGGRWRGGYIRLMEDDDGGRIEFAGVDRRARCDTEALDAQQGSVHKGKEWTA